MPMQTRLYTSLDKSEKTRIRAEVYLLFPEILKSGRRDSHKYDRVVLYILVQHGVLCHQVRDLFSAGSVAVPGNNERGGLYIERALKLIEDEMRKVALEMDDALFIEYWGKSVPPEKRISKWLNKADKAAHGWKPSKVLFQK